LAAALGDIGKIGPLRTTGRERGVVGSLLGMNVAFSVIALLAAIGAGC
jgi:hypothetical protein